MSNFIQELVLYKAVVMFLSDIIAYTYYASQNDVILIKFSC